MQRFYQSTLVTLCELCTFHSWALLSVFLGFGLSGWGRSFCGQSPTCSNFLRFCSRSGVLLKHANLVISQWPWRTALECIARRSREVIFPLYCSDPSGVLGSPVEIQAHWSKSNPGSWRWLTNLSIHHKKRESLECSAWRMEGSGRCCPWIPSGRDQRRWSQALLSAWKMTKDEWMNGRMRGNRYKQNTEKSL